MCQIGGESFYTTITEDVPATQGARRTRVAIQVTIVLEADVTARSVIDVEGHGCGSQQKERSGLYLLHPLFLFLDFMLHAFCTWLFTSIRVADFSGTTPHVRAKLQVRHLFASCLSG